MSHGKVGGIIFKKTFQQSSQIIREFRMSEKYCSWQGEACIQMESSLFAKVEKESMSDNEKLKQDII